jgi:cation-transporting P-type ATPase 13A2
MSNWRDPSWRKLQDIVQGLEGETHEARKGLFGDNVINIEEKPILRLLIDEVLHPFYIFQVFSIILWSADEYYYYAACIFIISVVSVSSTLIETRQTMQRMREMARYICQVRVLRNGFWRTVSSADLVPGDIYEVSDPHLTIFPCDALLLTGDAIVNESMLTGESVPVSKLPCTRNEELYVLSLTSTISSELAKHFLYSGTKIVRVRRGTDKDVGAAIAMVVRTGFNTTKGSLVRSMLFPRPNQFRFYRDSFRFIEVMAVIACLGFIVSIVNFIRLGVCFLRISKLM